ncbi:MAG: 2,3-bisphosphoglycerate-independent phosphoglycerate mutase [Parcubacteria group bacterium GW2011_GWC2_44_17]|uniref:2,3-bisphosphoglycerate-independent phosphoglycerate mutase n=1 Tax=Candidatus Jacksonbacteria bacterium RIFCSPLOWO2_02_FULL_44_20 TaxID=1798460 RepID=A0A1G2A6U6_9BACT|nr:MAG: 2,3-bisphosphoglycerate-independent phosphoglycerate mutase [Parcubacteria group bacterium GW2011_GWC2_44_17]KKT48702.1 MAG: 2,3-bisphosphoglycerate-independent phosphoglycerate mutase [Parcubacteria group bacterium GW2011_GWF2_44_17]OGY70780.1 MAG: phosphoglycerate mutase (2,3-diphosphoglycerate-independent) [Candidatus Jacksonbacteria bacterium RIFCSPHIGHO2_02_FULL_44_25]OGY72463.1 MAG: phosphoglycerate mutase (2,3-diphosphoglycerate-independent) [Candidatus Jacksonbacteria bacterium R
MKPVLLIINDGWGIAPPSRYNAITEARTPVFDYLIQHYFTVTLQASGESVGLPWGEIGNSEVGHLSLGSGRIVYQELPRINRAISDGDFFQNEKFLSAARKIKNENGAFHIAGIFSNGGVHGHIEHLFALLEFCVKEQVPRVFIHAFLDGRDTPYASAPLFLKQLDETIARLRSPARIISIAGRFWAMDRDSRYERIEPAYLAIASGKSEKTFASADEAVASFYSENIFDEQIPPTVIGESAPITNRDALIFFNYRADRARQIVRAFTDPKFTAFPRAEFLETLRVVTFTQYDYSLPVSVAFPGEHIEYPLARIISEKGIRQLHIAETEKYAHVTYFFNGGREEPYPLEDRALITSPKVLLYDETPMMSAREISEELLKRIEMRTYGFFVVNFSNADMVGHTGNLKATILAVETLDGLFKPIVEQIVRQGGVVVITSDHGNAEAKVDPQTGDIKKEHTANAVPLIIVGKQFIQEKSITPDLSAYIPSGVLADVAPTILSIMGITIPKMMTGRALV